MPNVSSVMSQSNCKLQYAHLSRFGHVQYSNAIGVKCTTYTFCSLKNNAYLDEYQLAPYSPFTGYDDYYSNIVHSCL